MVVWWARRETFGVLPSPLRGLSTVVVTFFAMFSTVAILISHVLWDALKPFGVVQQTVEPVVVFGFVFLWWLFLAGLFIRAIIRSFRGRYEHHGIALGVGPIYFYFRRRRIS